MYSLSQLCRRASWSPSAGAHLTLLRSGRADPVCCLFLCIWTFSLTLKQGLGSGVHVSTSTTSQEMRRERKKLMGYCLWGEVRGGLRVSETIFLKLNSKVIFLVSLFVVLRYQGANDALITGLVCQMCNVPLGNLGRQPRCDCLELLLS